jgi:hypothetical protein
MTSRVDLVGIPLLIALAAANAACTLGPIEEGLADVSPRRVLADASQSARQDAGIPEPDASLPSAGDAGGPGPDASLPPSRDAGGPEPDASLPSAGDAGGPGPDASFPPSRDAGGPEPDASLPPTRDAGGPGPDASFPPSRDAGGPEPDASLPSAGDAGGPEPDASLPSAGDAGGPEPDASLPPTRDAGGPGPDASLPPDGDAGNPAVEVCDGIDNDGNGIIDDIDTGRDGVCDCLRVATLGYPGTWGSGNVFKDWLDAKINSAVVSLGAETLTPQALAAFQIVVVQDVRADSPGSQGPGNGIGRDYSEAEIQALTDWVDRGGGLLTLSGYGVVSELGNVNRMLAPFGLSYEARAIFKGTGSAVTISHWSKHPISEGIQAVGVYGAYPVAGGSLLAWEPEPGNWDIGRVAEFGSGRVVAWGDEWISYTSKWNSDFQGERFWLNSLKWLTLAGHCQVPTSPIRQGRRSLGAKERSAQ